MDLKPITATILTKNSARHLPEVLESLTWCEEVIVLDTGSTDDTMEIARLFPGVVVHRLVGPFPGFGAAHRLAVQLAKHDWILSVDSDEVISAELASEIGELSLDPRCVYILPFQNFFNGRSIKSCGWSPDCHERLFHRRATNFCESAVHERVQTKTLTTVKLRGAVRHYSYDSLGDFLRKMSDYGRLFAQQNVGRKKSGPGKAVARAAWAFLKSYFFQRGVFDGYEGLVISAYKAQVVFWKYLLLHEANRRTRA